MECGPPARKGEEGGAFILLVGDNSINLTRGDLTPPSRAITIQMYINSRYICFYMYIKYLQYVYMYLERFMKRVMFSSMSDYPQVYLAFLRI